MQTIFLKTKLIIVSLSLVFFMQSIFSYAEDSYLHFNSYQDNENNQVISLEKAINRAMDASPRLRSAMVGIDIAKGAQLQADALPNPELSFEAEDFAGSDQYGGTNSAEYTLSFNQKIELGGKRVARKRVAQTSYAIANETVSIEQLNIIHEVHTAYLNVLAEGESVGLAIEQEQLANNVFDIVSKRVDAAAESEIQLSKAEVTLANTLILKEQTARQLQIARHTLAKLWGSASFHERLDQGYLYELEEPDSYEIYVSRLTKLPDLQRFEYESANKDSLFDLAKTEGIVDPTVSVGVRRFEEGSDNAFLVGISIPLQIFNKNQGNIAKAQAEYWQSQSNAHQFELNLRQNLFDNWQTWRTAYAEAAHLKNKLLPAADKSFRLAQSAYERGRFTYLEVLDAQRTLIDARDQYLTTLRRYHNARINVKRLTNSFGEQG